MAVEDIGDSRGGSRVRIPLYKRRFARVGGGSHRMLQRDLPIPLQNSVPYCGRHTSFRHNRRTYILI